jgi:uncharacterized membrane protein YccF (DUF307 family)
MTMKNAIRLLKVFAMVWFVLAGLFIIACLIMIWLEDGFQRVAEILSPFNIWNFAMMVIAFSPGFGAQILAGYLEKKNSN